MDSLNYCRNLNLPPIGAATKEEFTDWVSNCRSNESEDETLEDWICRACNAHHATVDPEFGFWVNYSHISDPNRVAEIMDTIDSGV